jgi:sensor histidine kinase YesM
MSGREPTFRWELSGELSGAVVPPTTLLTLVENVFKHGDPYCPCLPPQIRVSVGRDLCTISVSNTCSKGKPTPDGHGLGLANLRKRLHHVFQNRYQMVCSCHKGVHSVDITIEF